MNFAVAEAHRSDGKPFIVRIDEKLISFVLSLLIVTRSFAIRQSKTTEWQRIGD